MFLFNAIYKGTKVYCRNFVLSSGIALFNNGWFHLHKSTCAGNFSCKENE